METQVSKLSSARFAGLAGLLVVAILGFHGCITVSAVEHRIKVNPDGSGIAVIKFLDFRSDAVNDSAYTEDLNQLLDILGQERIEEFEKGGKKILKKELYLSRDSLSLRVEYEFRSLQSIDGIRVSADKIFFVVDESRRVVSTNGEIENQNGGGKRMVWKAGARYFSYLIEDAVSPQGRSLSQAYRQWMEGPRE